MISVPFAREHVSICEKFFSGGFNLPDNERLLVLFHKIFLVRARVDLGGALAWLLMWPDVAVGSTHSSDLLVSSLSNLDPSRSKEEGLPEYSIIGFPAISLAVFQKKDAGFGHSSVHHGAVYSYPKGLNRPPYTIYAPTDYSISIHVLSSVSRILQQRTLPGAFSVNYMRTLAFGTKIETMTPVRCITVTSDLLNSTKLSIGGVEIDRPNPFNNGFAIVHGLSGYVSHLPAFSCILGPAHAVPALSFKRLMLRDASMRLRISGYSVPALALRVKYADLASLHNAIVIGDAAISSILDIGGGEYPSDRSGSMIGASGKSVAVDPFIGCGSEQNRSSEWSVDDQTTQSLGIWVPFLSESGDRRAETGERRSESFSPIDGIAADSNIDSDLLISDDICTGDSDAKDWSTAGFWAIIFILIQHGAQLSVTVDDTLISVVTVGLNLASGGKVGGPKMIKAMLVSSGSSTTSYWSIR